MTKPKFTPGPWRVRRFGPRNIWFEVETVTQGKGYRHITNEMPSGYTEGEDWHQALADARLIAKAPEMYGLVETLVKLGSPLLDESVSFLRNRARRIKAEIDEEG